MNPKQRKLPQNQKEGPGPLHGSREEAACGAHTVQRGRRSRACEGREGLGFRVLGFMEVLTGLFLVFVGLRMGFVKGAFTGLTGLIGLQGFRGFWGDSQGVSGL